jgi:hypothetical protein
VRPRIDALLCALGCAGADLTVPLAEWEELTGPIRHLHERVTSDLVWKNGRPRLMNPSWDKSGPQHRQLIAWLIGEAAATALSAAFARTGDEGSLELPAEIDQVVAT